jgi:hypothetical protein
MDMLRFDSFAKTCCAGGAVGVVGGRRRVTARPATAAGMILAQNSVDSGDDQHVPEPDDGGKSAPRRRVSLMEEDSIQTVVD